MSATDKPTLESLAETVADLQAELDAVRAENEQLRDRVDELEADLADVRERAGEGRADLSRRLHDLEERERDRDADLTARASDAGDEPDPATPLEQIVDLLEHVAEANL